MLLDVLLAAQIDLPFGAWLGQLLDGRIDTLLAVWLVVRLGQLCCVGCFCPAPSEVDCCVAPIDLTRSAEDPVLDLVLHLHPLELVQDPAHPQLLELLRHKQLDVLLLGTGIEHRSSMSPSGRPGYRSPSLLLHWPGYLSSSSSSLSASWPRYLSLLSPSGRSGSSSWSSSGRHGYPPSSLPLGRPKYPSP